METQVQSRCSFCEFVVDKMELDKIFFEHFIVSLPVIPSVPHIHLLSGAAVLKDSVSCLFYIQYRAFQLPSMHGTLNKALKLSRHTISFEGDICSLKEQALKLCIKVQ